MEYSIIIPYHSNRTHLCLCLESLIATVPQTVEIILVINNSDPQEHLIDINRSRIQVITINQNLGYSKAINLGVTYAKGKHLIFCDSDTVYTKNWFKALTGFYHSKANIGIASSKLLNPNTSRIIDFGMALSKYNNAHPFLDQFPTYPLVQESRKVQMACSANMIITKELFCSMGMLDETLVNFYQDNDLCLRLKDFKKECWVVADSIVFHKGNSSVVNRSPYQADIKGYYVANNASRMEIDLQNYYKESFHLLKGKFHLKDKYLLMDLSTVADREWYHAIIKSYFPVIDIYQSSANKRDADKISLIDSLGYNILCTKIPIIYFVDRFISLEENHLWEIYRGMLGSADVIIDRNANMETFKSLHKPM